MQVSPRAIVAVTAHGQTRPEVCAVAAMPAVEDTALTTTARVGRRIARTGAIAWPTAMSMATTTHIPYAEA